MSCSKMTHGVGMQYNHSEPPRMLLKLNETSESPTQPRLCRLLLRYKMDAQYQNVDRRPCRICNRQFIPESLAIHERVCAKNSQKKRKVFDSTKQRVDGTDLNIRQVKQAQKKDVPAPRSNWRAQHQDFISTVRAARGVSVAIKEGKPLPPPPPPSINPDYVQCPCCQRRFNQKAAERHIAFCKEKSQRLPSKPQGSGAAQAKQSARLQYQAPRPKAKTGPGAASPNAMPPNRVPSTGAARSGTRMPAASSASRGKTTVPSYRR